MVWDHQPSRSELVRLVLPSQGSRPGFSKGFSLECEREWMEGERE